MLSVIVAFQLAFVKVRCKLVTFYAFNHVERVVCLIDSFRDHTKAQLFFKAFWWYVMSAAATWDAVCFIPTICNVINQPQSQIKHGLKLNRIFLKVLNTVTTKLTRRRTRRSKAVPFYSTYARTGAPTEARLLYYSWRYCLSWTGAMVYTSFTARWFYPFDLTVNLKYRTGRIKFNYWHKNVISKILSLFFEIYGHINA